MMESTCLYQSQSCNGQNMEEYLQQICICTFFYCAIPNHFMETRLVNKMPMLRSNVTYVNVFFILFYKYIFLFQINYVLLNFLFSDEAWKNVYASTKMLSITTVLTLVIIKDISSWYYMCQNSALIHFI